jgi:hypothetical protein
MKRSQYRHYWPFLLAQADNESLSSNLKQI